MKIAITYENGQIFQHFGHTENFKVYDIEGGKVVSSRVVPASGDGHCALSGFLKGLGADTLICGGIGGGARMALAEAGIKLCPGVCGDADKAAEAFAAGTLSFDPDAECRDHEHDHAHGHDCGGHGCGHHGGHVCGDK